LTQASVWEGIICEIRSQLNEDTFDRWFGQCVVRDMTPEELTIEVPSIFYRNWIIEHFGGFIQQHLRETTGREPKFSIQIAGDNGASEPAKKGGGREKKKATRPRRPSLNNGSKLNPKYTFENFIEGSCNRFARAACMAAAQAPGRAYNPLFIYGGVGLGKTHLMQAVGHSLLSHLEGAKIHYVSSESFTNHLINSLQTRQMDQFRRSYRDVSALLIDDIQFLSGKERTQEEFFHTFNTLFDLRSQIVVSADRSPVDLAHMEERLVSRFQSGLVVDLQVPDLETRVAILLNDATYLRIELPDDVAFFIADNITCNIRELEGALVRVASYASLMKRPLTVGLAQHVLQDILLRQGARAVSIDTIQKKVSEHFDVRVADMKSPRRPKIIAHPRQVAMFLCRELTRHSLQEIGDAFGGRNHATVIHAHRQILQKMPGDSQLRMAVSRLKEELARA
jgi:chromosomal replication initiator protein